MFFNKFSSSADFFDHIAERILFIKILVIFFSRIEWLCGFNRCYDWVCKPPT